MTTLTTLSTDQLADERAARAEALRRAMYGGTHEAKMKAAMRLGAVIAEQQKRAGWATEAEGR